MATGADDVIYKVLQTLRIRGWATDEGAANRTLVEAIVSVVFEEFEVRMKHYIDAVQLMGDQVDNHNQILLATPPIPEPVEPKNVFWDCYCGTRNAAGRTCMVCERTHAPLTAVLCPSILRDVAGGPAACSLPANHEESHYNSGTGWHWTK